MLPDSVGVKEAKFEGTAIGDISPWMVELQLAMKSVKRMETPATAKRMDTGRL
jgi:hypothetical protein